MTKKALRKKQRRKRKQRAITNEIKGGKND
nr:MAG TPA: hypothetical protein [Caudoviricetes sp.]DAS46508.1 MAG TPA: hypothetical protein [Caudoviricetes sp.]DAY06811.1 MAG TPA: hypothetical protein [Caudoviricetes sp.]